MKILSIHDGHNASAGIFNDNKILSCISEERLNRIKFFWGWPELAIAKVFEETGLTLDDIDAVTISHFDTKNYIKRKLSLAESYNWRPKIFFGQLYNILQTAQKEKRVRKFAKGKKIKDIYFCDHHLAHAASAYYFSGFEDALVVTIDGLGDSLSHTAYEVKNRQWNWLVRGGTQESLGAFYAAITEGLGFKPNRHEGKIVGLAAFGDYKELEGKDENWFVKISDDKLHFKRNNYAPMVNKARQLIQEGHERQDVAAYSQYLLEKLVVEHVNKLCQLTGAKNLALAGGVFSNVKLNERLAEKCPIEKIFIQPAMGDEGLVLGSAAYYLDKILKKKFGKIENVYFGPSFNDEQIEEILKENGYQHQISDDAPRRVAELVDQGKIVGWFDGRMEFGPRALGSRSILADPRNKNINDILNKRLKRSEFMPFAPSALYDKAEEVFEHVEQAWHPAEFMTITFQVKKNWQDKIRAVVHVDGTARPQLVKKEVNYSYYEIINEYYKLSGIPLLVNTSFNMHEEPIVCTPEDALRSFDSGAVDYLFFNNKFIVSK